MKVHHKIVLLISLLLICSPILANDIKQEESKTISIPDYNLSIASQNQGILQNQIYAQTDYSGEPDPIKYPKYKSEEVAFIIALVPGFIIHGMGHYYAGDFLTGTVLLGLEVVSIGVLLGQAMADGLGGTSIGQKYGMETEFVIGSFVTFFATWVYDFIHAPIVVRNYNKKIQARIMFSSDQYNDLKVSLAFSF